MFIGFYLKIMKFVKVLIELVVDYCFIQIEMVKYQVDCLNFGEDFGELLFFVLELQVLNYLDESIRFYDIQIYDNCFNNRFGSEFRFMD